MCLTFSGGTGTLLDGYLVIHYVGIFLTYGFFVTWSFTTRNLSLHGHGHAQVISVVNLYNVCLVAIHLKQV